MNDKNKNEVIKWSTRITSLFLSTVTAVTMAGCKLNKNKNNNDIDKTYNYLRSRAFDYFPYPIEESNKYEIYPYIEDVYEPYLIQIGYISRTPRGRMVMPPAYEHLGYTFLG